MPERLCPGHQPRLTAEPCQGRGSVPKGRLYSPVLRRSRRRAEPQIRTGSAHLLAPAHPDPGQAPSPPKCRVLTLGGRPALRGLGQGAGVLSVALAVSLSLRVSGTQPRPGPGTATLSLPFTPSPAGPGVVGRKCWLH
uniref:Uncharacterized protein n=1 Tax=Myotis myotis TaxID=51298 RepID=A0A7J7RDL2_MYOMY|nr:hypothetical protein mMyoMyo1_010379 [Myotis myotis]